MLSEDENALICDFAETYHIYDYKQLQPSKAAIFASGLRQNSRIKMKLADQTTTLDTLMLAAVVDRLSILIWAQTKDGQKGVNRPASLADMLSGKLDKQADVIAFGSGKDFETTRNKIIMQIEGSEGISQQN